MSESIADLSGSATQSADSAWLGQPLTYVFTVVNAGPDTAPDVDVAAMLPSDATFVSATATQGAGCANSAGVVSCALGALTSGDSAVVTIVVVPDAAGRRSITGSVTSTATDTNPADNEATLETSFAVVPKGIITPAQPFATADPARRYVGNRAFETDDGGFMVVGVSYPASGQQYGTSFM